MAVAFVLVALSVGTVQKVESRREAASIGFGEPLAYLEVDREWQWDGGPAFRTRWNPKEDTEVDFRLELFLLDWVLVAFVLCAPLWLIASWRHGLGRQTGEGRAR